MPDVQLLVIADPAARFLSVLQTLPEGVRVTTSLDPEVLRAAAPTTGVVFNTTSNGQQLRAIWPLLTNLRWVHSMSAGVENQLFPELFESPLPLTNGRGVFKESLGEFVLTAALYFAKDLRRMMRNHAAGRWEQFDVEEISRQTMGIVGYGEIGRSAARRAKAMGMKILATRRRESLNQGDDLLDQAFPLDQMGDMLAQSDVVVVSAPLTTDTRGLVGEAEFARMKPTAILVNVGRGPVVDEAALVRALTEKRIRGAALDVFDVEPLPEGHPLWALDNVLFSPHCADHTSDWLEQAAGMFVANFRRFAAGEPLLNLVDKKAGY